MKRNSRAMTLPEILVVLALIGLVALVALGSVKLAFTQWGGMAQKFRAAQKARFVLSTMENELRQGLPWRDTTDGYLRTGADVAPTALLAPNEKVLESARLEFTEPHPDFYFPLDEGWNSETPRNFRNVTYRVRGGNEVVREVQTHDRVPPPPLQTEVIASAPAREDGRPGFELTFRFLDSNLCQLEVLVRDGTWTESVRTRCFLVGR